MKDQRGPYIYELAMRVRDYEVDAEGIVNNANYLHYLEHTRHEFCREAGLTFRQMHQEGIDPVLSRVDIRYRLPLGLGDEMVSRLALRRRGPVFLFIQDIFTPDGRVVVEADVHVVCLENGRLSRGDRLLDVFAKYLAD